MKVRQPVPGNRTDSKRQQRAEKAKPLSQLTEQFSERILSANANPDEQAHIWSCNFCGNEVLPFRFDIGERVRFIRKPYCDCAEAQAAKQTQDEAERLQEQQRQAEMMIETAGLNIGKRKRMQFSTWDAKRSVTAGQVVKHVLDYTDTVTQTGTGNWLYLHGGYGLGKTHLAIAAVRKIVAQHLWKPYVVVWPDYCTRVQQTWGGDQSGTEYSEAQLWGQMKIAGMLLIDDIDKRQPTPWAMGKLYEVIDFRYLREKPTIITANHSLLELSDLWSQKTVEVRDAGAAIISRIAEQLWATIEFTGQDQRMC